MNIPVAICKTHKDDVINVTKIYSDLNELGQTNQIKKKTQQKFGPILQFQLGQCNELLPV